MVAMDECIFCKIAKGEVPSKKVFEDKDTIAFLDINPANPGHTLVMPKKHSENIFDIGEADLQKTMAVVKDIATKLKENMEAVGVNVVQNNGRPAGQLVSHTHFHVIPRFPEDNVIITYKRVHMEEKDLDEIVKRMTAEKKADKADYSRWDMSGL